MDKTSDTIINELFSSLDHKVSSVPESDNTSTYSMAESIKKYKRHDKSKKHKKHKKKSKKIKKKKYRSRSNSVDNYIELKLNKRDKLEEVKSGMPVTLDVVMETIVTTANEKSEKIKDNKHDNNDNNHEEKTIDENIVQTPEHLTNQTSNKFLQIYIII